MSTQLSNGLLARRRRIRPLNPSTLSLVTNVKADANAIVCPPVLAGDLLVFTNFSAQNGGAPPAVAPSGFTLINNQLAGPSTFFRHTLYYKLAIGSEGGTSLSGMNGADQKLISLGVFRKTPAITGVSISAINADNGFGTGVLPDQIVPSGTGVLPLLVLANFGIETAATARASISPAEDGTYSAVWANVSSYADMVKFKFFDNSSQDVVVSMDTSGIGSNLRKSMRSLYITLT